MIHNCVRCTVKIYKQKQQQQTSKKPIALSLIKTKKGQSRDMIFLRIFEIEFMFHFLCFFFCFLRIITITKKEQKQMRNS
jgi:hypothetical protein